MECNYRAIFILVCNVYKKYFKNMLARDKNKVPVYKKKNKTRS